MKVKIKDLHPNPFRDIASYPLIEEKVLLLEESIKQTGFWHNLSARKHNGEIQIAYGHHRLEALRRMMSPDYEVDIRVEEISDVRMLQMMANENMEHWSATPAVINHTVKVTREFLLKNPEIAAKYGQVHKSTQTGENMIGADLIARFLNWTPTKVSESLERLHLINTGVATQLVFDYCSTNGAARTIVDVLKEQEKQGTPVPLEKQPEIAKKYRESGNSKKVLKETVREVMNSKPDKEEPEDELVKEFGVEAIQIIEGITWLEDALKNLEYKYKRNEVPDQWGDKNWHQIMMDNLLRILGQIYIFIRMYKIQPSVAR